MSECGCVSNVRLVRKDPITVVYEDSGVDHSKCDRHSDAALAALKSDLAQLRQQVEAEVREDDAKVAEGFASSWVRLSPKYISKGIAAELRRRIPPSNPTTTPSI